MIVAITGGIGSGKSFVCRLLEQRGVAVYDCDAAAKRLIKENRQLQEQLDALVGNLLTNGQMDRKRLAQYILASKANALAVDNIVHPAVADDFRRSGLTWIESAILFDSGFDSLIDLDYVVCVTAPIATRIERIMRRDSISEAAASAWIEAQMSQEELVQRANYVIDNAEGSNIDQQVDDLLNEITNNKQ